MSWADLVTTALLGTGRRPVPQDIGAWAESPGGSTDLAPDERVSPESWVLDLAATHRVAVLAGRPSEPAGRGLTAATVPAQTLPIAPAEADRLLGGFLAAGDNAATGRWLGVCERHGCGVAPAHWSRLAALASRSPTYDRGKLAAVLGGRGRWFVRQNPEWARLAAALDAAVAGEAEAGVRTSGAGRGSGPEGSRAVARRRGALGVLAARCSARRAGRGPAGRQRAGVRPGDRRPADRRPVRRARAVRPAAISSCLT